MSTIHKVQDNSVKMILSENELLVEFLQNFIPIDILKDINPADIEDVTERFLTLIAEQKDGDTIKRINLKDDKSLFVVAIVEHESAVNFRASFKMLLYIALILDAYEKDANKREKGINRTKDFKYPPILPIVFYDGTNDWTADTNFLYRTEMSEIFEKYIPKFEYELVSLNKYSVTDLAEFGNMLSLFMIISKIKTADDFSVMKELPEGYIQRFDDMNIPPHLKELLVKVITVLLTKADVPKEEIEILTAKIDERGISQMIALENYSVQETRRIARAEADRRADNAERQLEKARLLLQSTIQSLLAKGNTVTEVAGIMNVSEQDIVDLLPELA